MFEGLLNDCHIHWVGGCNSGRLADDDQKMTEFPLKSKDIFVTICNNALKAP
jgi:hypothetical protein